MHRVGLIGLGKMGLPIARNLMERGFAVTGYRRSGSPELAAAGGTVAGSSAEVAAEAEVLLSIVPDAAAVEEIICGQAGTLTTLRPGTIHIEMSTIDIGHKTRLRDAVRARGGDLLDCPVSGSPGMVAPRRATTFASGDRASVDRVAPVLDAVSGPWVYTGEFGTGARMKYIANLLLAVHTVAAAEALVLARRSGLDLDLVQATLDGSIAESAIWQAARPADARAGLDTRARAGRHPASHPRADRGLRGRGRPGRPGVHRGQGSLRQGARRRLGRPRHRVCSRPDLRRVRPQSGRAFMTWSLVTYLRNGTDGVAILRDDGTLAAPTELKRWATVLELVEDWGQAEGVLRGLDTDGAPAVEHDALLPPLRWPRKVVCAGVNYRRHMQEMGGEIPAEGWRPFFFLKAPTTTIVGPHDPIIVRSPDEARYDWEAELAVVIGVGGRDIPAADALAHVAGYCVANDVTARGRHRRQAVPAEAFIYDWFAAKSMDSSLPLGPGITPAFQVPDPQDLRLRLWVNGELQQDESTSDMVCPVAELVSAASEVVTLEPGDVIATGTPSGVGAGRGLYLRAGDVVRVTIDGLGILENTVIDPAGGTS